MHEKIIRATHFHKRNHCVPALMLLSQHICENLSKTNERYPSGVCFRSCGMIKTRTTDERGFGKTCVCAETLNESTPKINFRNPNALLKSGNETRSPDSSQFRDDGTSRNVWTAYDSTAALIRKLFLQTVSSHRREACTF
jgi:hypothetical protein